MYLELADEPRAEQVRRLVQEEAERRFDLAQGPLFRVSLLKLGAEEHVLLLTLHHIISDGWSQGVMLRELSVLYGAFLARSAPRRSRPCRFNTPTMRCGSVVGCKVRCWRRRFATGRSDLQERRRVLSCRVIVAATGGGKL